MASAKKTHTRKPARRHLPATEDFDYGCFMQDMLEGEIQATTLEEEREGGKLIKIEYDDPDGDRGAGMGGAGTPGETRSAPARQGV